LADDRTETVAIPGKRKKWSHVQNTLDSLRWWKLEALNAQGAILGVIENDEPAEDLEELTDYQGATSEQAKLLSLMLRAQDVALRRHEGIVEKMLKVNVQLSEVLMARLNTLEKAYQSNLTALQKAAGAEGGDGMGEMMSSAAIEAIMPELMKKMLGFSPAAPKAGNSKPPIDVESE
jgi:hypothetical protein